MRATKSGAPDQIRERYLGEIAPLLAAARNVESFSPAEKKQIRKRVLRTLFRPHSLHLRFRLTPVLVGVGLLVAGGVAFATAERLGWIRSADQGPPNSLAKTVAGEARKHRPTGSKSAPRNGEALTDQAVVALPEVPDPLLFATTPMLGASKAVAMRKSAPGSVPLAPDPRFAKPSTRPTKNLALATPYLAEPVALPPSLPSAPAAGQTERAGLEPVPLAAASVAVPTVQPKAELPKTEPSDSVLFGRALRTLRSESDPTAALALLEEHARAYPRSALAGERRVLEVEALLALHRDREALQRLDGMPLDQLPRSGERFVVRGELRAAARRWQEAQADFDRALSRVSGSPAWHERALWGRGVSRLRCGEQEAGLADVERYHDLYPKGRFAAEAGRFFRNQ